MSRCGDNGNKSLLHSCQPSRNNSGRNIIENKIIYLVAAIIIVGIIVEFCKPASCRCKENRQSSISSIVNKINQLRHVWFWNRSKTC